jgi:hypothetical protein
MQTAVGRPFIFAFEDEGGILPIYNVGLSAAGRVPSGGLNLQYVACETKITARPLTSLYS